MWFVLIPIAVVTYIIYWAYYKPDNFPSGPPRVPILGSLPFLKMDEEPLMHLAFEETGKRWNCKNGMMGMYLNSAPTIAVWNPKVVREVLQRDEFQGRQDSFVTKFRSFGKKQGVFFGDGPSWVEQRRFTIRQLRDLGVLGLQKVQHQVQFEISELLRHIRSQPHGTVKGSHIVQGDQLFSVHIINILWALIAGKRHSYDDEEFQTLLNLVNRLFRRGQLASEYLNAFPALSYLFPGFFGYTEMMESITNVQDFIRDSLNAHRETFNENNIRDFLDSYIHEMKLHESEKDSAFCEEEVITICMDLFLAGSESIGNTLSFALIYLVRNPDVQDRLWNEMEKQLGIGCCPCLDDRSRLPYLEAVLQEVMRVNSIAPLAVNHRAIKDTTLAGYTIAKDTELALSLWSVAHDPIKYPEPYKFRPERFIDSNGQFVRDEGLLLFGAGRRLCVGMAFAKSSLFLFFGALVANFKFECVPGDPLPSDKALPGFTTSPRPFRVLAIERKAPS